VGEGAGCGREGERVRGGVRRRWGVGAQVYRPPQARTQCERNPWPVKRPPHTGQYPVGGPRADWAGVLSEAAEGPVGAGGVLAQALVPRTPPAGGCGS